jgi:hypothetical protein
VPGWKVEAAGPTRVLAVRGSLPDEVWTKVRERLAAGIAERPANKEIDLKAIGAKPAALDEESFKELMKSPAVQEEMNHRDLSKERAAGTVSADGRVYTNPLLGFSIRLPESLQGWKMSTQPGDARFLVSIANPEATIFLTVSYETNPEKLPISSFSGGMELGIKAMLPSYRKLREEGGERPGYHFQALWFEAPIEGTTVTGVLRYLGRGSQLYFLLAAGPEELWEQQRASVLAVLDSFTLLEPAAA